MNTESWQHSPAKNLIESNSVKEWTKLLENTTCVSISSSFRYPDFRYACTNCGSLEVLLNPLNYQTTKKIKCLDCNHEEFN